MLKRLVGALAVALLAVMGVVGLAMAATAEGCVTNQDGFCVGETPGGRKNVGFGRQRAWIARGSLGL
jgi:hypothetical protein